MEKQHNRGQDGVGVATIKLDPKPGSRYISRRRSNAANPIQEVFKGIFHEFKNLEETAPHRLKDPQWLKHNMKYLGEVMLGHLRYGTHGGNSIEACHPFLRQNNWMARNLVLAGNFNMTNVAELFNQLIELGQHPKELSDTVTVLEKIGHFLDMENQRIFDEYKKQGYENEQISHIIAEKLDLQRILSKSVKDFDGGYVMAGLIGHGDAFVVRDPNGIRPAFYYVDEEVAVVASERPAIQTVFNTPLENVKELKPGHALVIKKNGKLNEVQCRVPEEKTACSFERIYFSRGTDKDIYQERKALGRLLTEKVVKSINYDFENTVFSFIPNTAEISFYGMMEGLNEHLNLHKKKLILEKGISDPGEIDRIIHMQARVEKLAIKDAKLRTFITEDASRDELVSHVYDVTYGLVRKNVDTVVAIDDSIVRGTTLQKSILSILDRLEPKKIVIVSSAPQIRFPDCYGIDMSKMKDFVAFRAAIELLKDRKQESLLRQIYEKCIEENKKPLEEIENKVQELYEQFSDDEISAKISQILKPKHIFSDVEIIYQSIENLHEACPNHKGDWYFSGNFPTNGGNKVVNKAFINYIEGSSERAY